jgi:predicted dehydrogenase
MGLRFGLIGAGLAAPLFGGALAAGPRDARLVAVASRREESGRAFAERYGVERRYLDWREMVASPDIDAVCIATPTGSHAEMAIAAANAGKHVLTEKPMATTLTDADAMIHACQANGVTLGVIFMYRFMDTTLKMKQAINEGRIGKPILGECVGKFLRTQAYYDSGDWRGTWSGEGGGALMTQTSHTLDLMIWLLGDVESLGGFYTTTATHSIETDDLAVASIRFTSGALGSVISSSAISPPSDRVLTIHGESGTVGIVGDRLARWNVTGDPDPETERMLAEEAPDRGNTAAVAGYVDSELHRRQIDDFIAAIQEGRQPLVDAAEGRRTLEVMRALYLSSEQRRLITFPVVEPVS